MSELPKRIYVDGDGSWYPFTTDTSSIEYLPASELEEAKKLLREARQHLNPALSTSEEIDAFLEGK